MQWALALIALDCSAAMIETVRTYDCQNDLGCLLFAGWRHLARADDRFADLAGDIGQRSGRVRSENGVRFGRRADLFKRIEILGHKHKVQDVLRRCARHTFLKIGSPTARKPSTMAFR